MALFTLGSAVGGLLVGLAITMRTLKKPVTPSSPTSKEMNQDFAWVERHQRLRNQVELRKAHEQVNRTRKRIKRQALHLNVSPHFMFNALSSVQWLWGKGQLQATRRSFEAFIQIWNSQWAPQQDVFHSLEKEVSTLSDYVALEGVRLGREIQLDWVIEPEVQLEGLMPRMLLQPTIENALWHGFLESSNPPKLCIQISKCATKRNLSPSQWINVHVLDNGIGITNEECNSDHPSEGLKLTADLLLHLDSKAGFQLREAEAPWSTEAHFWFPLNGPTTREKATSESGLHPVSH